VGVQVVEVGLQQLAADGACREQQGK
jgi:hypothetical protein